MLAERLRRLRQERKLKQVEVAEAVGLSLHGYQDLEREVIPRGGVLLNLAEFYDVSIDWLMGRTEKREVNRGCLPLEKAAGRETDGCGGTPPLLLHSGRDQSPGQTPPSGGRNAE